MGLFGCSHPKWVKVGGVRDGKQQWKCSKCGRLRIRKAFSWECFFGSHQYGARIKGRKNAPTEVKCKVCGKKKPLGKGGTNA